MRYLYAWRTNLMLALVSAVLFVVTFRYHEFMYLNMLAGCCAILFGVFTAICIVFEIENLVWQFMHRHDKEESG